MSQPLAHWPPWRHRLHRIIFGVGSPAGRAFDVGLLWVILLSVAVVMLDSVQSIHDAHAFPLAVAEWVFTALFTFEYLARLVASPRRMRYVFSVYGLIDLLALLPTYLSLVFAGAQSLLVIRTLRLMRVFRVFKLTQYLFETSILMQAIRSSRRKVTVFVLFVLSVAVIMGALMYLVEGPQNGFTSIPRGMYWAIVTMTTVGYVDIAPHTVLGQTMAGALMIMGYGVLAVPTGIVSVELAQATRADAERIAKTLRSCPNCERGGHDGDAQYCKHCGDQLEPATS